MLVLKFGGTSLKDAVAMRRAISIVEMVKDKKPLVVLSATAGTTDELLKLAHAASKQKIHETSLIINNLEEKHLTIIHELIECEIENKHACVRIEKHLNNLKHLCEGISLLGELTEQTLDSIISFGELLSSAIFEAACRAVWLDTILIDARQILKIYKVKEQIKHTILKKKSNELLVKNLNTGKIVVTQGFIGSDEKNRSTTLGRGGSDYSAALFGASINADEIQIWTDVSGVKTTDPKLIPSAITIPYLSFTEMQDMAFFGAKVLHPDAIKPAIGKNIPVKILNTFDISNPGTVVVKNLELIENINAPKDVVIKAVVLKTGCSIISITLSDKKNKFQNIKSVLSFFEKLNSKIYNLMFTDNNLSIVLDTNKIVLNQLRKKFFTYNPVIENVELLVLIGENISMQHIAELLQFPEISEPIAVFRTKFSSSLVLANQSQDSLQLLKKVHCCLFE